QGGLYSVDRQTGKVAWKQEWLAFMVSGYATPVHWNHDGQDEVVVYTPRRLSGRRLRDGAEQWWVSVNAGACSSPTVGAGKLFVATWAHGGEPADRAPLPAFDKLLEQYDKNKDQKISKEEFPHDLIGLRRADAGDIPGAQVPL